MKNYIYPNRLMATIIFVSLFCLGTTAMAIEKAKYNIVESDLDFEIRQYAPQIVAETLVEGDFDKVGKEGFRRLFDYISGNNRKKTAHCDDCTGHPGGQV